MVGHVVLDESRQGRGALKNSSPGLKLGDIITEVSAVFQCCREALYDKAEFLDAIKPLAVD